jgi:NitT/TauT family transport system substrate-binding protein
MISRSARSAFLAAAGAAVAAGASSRAARAQATAEKLRIAAPFSDMFGEPYYGRSAGTFAHHGFDVDITTIFAGSAVVAAIAAGTVDVGVADMVSSAQAFNRGIPIRLLAGCALYLSSEPPQNFLCVAADSPIRQPRDLEGKSIGVPQIAGGTLVSLRAWYDAMGIDGTKVKLVEVPNTIAALAIARGTVDAGVVSEPFYTPSKSTLRPIGRPFDAIGKAFINTAWFTTRDWIEADRERARRAVAAIYETGRWANGHRSDTLEVLARDGKMDLGAIRGIARVTYATSTVLAQVQVYLTAAERYKAIDKPVDAAAFVAQP